MSTQYRMLDAGEIIQGGDEYNHPSQGWIPAVMIGEAPAAGALGHYRRPIAPAEQPAAGAHTPGPWSLAGSGTGSMDGIWSEESETEIAQCAGTSARIREANAALIVKSVNEAPMLAEQVRVLRKGLLEALDMLERHDQGTATAIRVETYEAVKGSFHLAATAPKEDAP